MDGSSCSFDNNGRFLALLTPDGRLKIWDCIAGSLKHDYTSPSHLSTTCTCLRWSRTCRSSVSAIPRENYRCFLEKNRYFCAVCVATGNEIRVDVMLN